MSGGAPMLCVHVFPAWGTPLGRLRTQGRREVEVAVRAAGVGGRLPGAQAPGGLRRGLPPCGAPTSLCLLCIFTAFSVLMMCRK